MLEFSRGQQADGAFLFIGFSLSDPNFTTIHDDLRLVHGRDPPAFYTVQGHRKVVKERYLRSLGVNTVWLDSWNELPALLGRLAPPAYLAAMEITVNGQTYADWSSIPADLMDKIAASQPDTNGSGVPDAFEGEGRVEATVTGDTVSVSSSSTSSTSSTSITVGGQDVGSWWKRLFNR